VHEGVVINRVTEVLGCGGKIVGKVGNTFGHVRGSVRCVRTIVGAVRVQRRRWEKSFWAGVDHSCLREISPRRKFSLFSHPRMKIAGQAHWDTGVGSRRTEGRCGRPMERFARPRPSPKMIERNLRHVYAYTT
jgi:hypothetical protein